MKVSFDFLRLTNIPNIEESGVYTIDAISDTSGVEYELDFNVTILKYYRPAYSGEALIGHDLVDVEVYAICKSYFLLRRERLELSDQLEEHIIEYFNL